MEYMEWGKGSRKTGWVPTKAIQKDEHSMENIDDFFNVTETSSIMNTPAQKVFNKYRENVLRQHTPSETNRQRTVTTSKYPVRNSSLNLEIPHIIQEDESELNNIIGNNFQESYETNYNLESENEISVNDADDKPNDSISIPDLRSTNISDVSREETSFNTSENALLEEEIEARNSEITSGNSFSAIASQDIEVVPDDEHISQHSIVERRLIRPTGQIRKSKRIKIPKLDYWRNEKIVYKRNHPQQVLDIDKIITFAEKQENKIPNTKRSTKKLDRNCTLKNVAVCDDKNAQWLKDGTFSIKFQNSSENSDALSTTVALAPDFREVSKTKTSRFNRYTLDTLFDDQRNFSSGNLTLPKDGIKSEDNTGGCFVTFHVTRGVLKTWIEGQSFLCPIGTTFQIPPFKDYKFKNIDDGETSLFFVQVTTKGKVELPEENTFDSSSDDI